jgi:hypothetical protein
MAIAMEVSQSHIDFLLDWRAKNSDMTRDDFDDLWAISTIYAPRLRAPVLLQLTKASHKLFYDCLGQQKAINGGAGMVVKRFTGRHPDPRNLQIDGLRQEIVAITACNASLEDQLRTADAGMRAAKSDLAAEVQKTHDAGVRESNLRYIIDTLDREKRIALAEAEDFRHGLVTAGNERQAMENKNAKHTACSDKARERIGVDGQQLSRAKDIEAKYNALLAKFPMGVIQATNGKAATEVFDGLRDMREIVDKDKNLHVEGESTDGDSAYRDLVKDT